MNDDLLVKYLLRETSPDERRAVETWIQDRPANQRYYEHFKLIWERSRELAATSTVDTEGAWQRFQDRVQEERVSSRGLVRTMNKKLSSWQAAAMLTGLVAIVAMIYYFTFTGSGGASVTLATTSWSQVDTLPDGSVITLNKHSSLSYAGAYNKKQRAVTLQGEAFFSVTPNKQKPFVVAADGLTVTVTGTSFNVKSLRGKTEVIVETGSVEVSNGRQTVVLKPGEKLSFAATDSMLVKEQNTDHLYRYYRDKTFVCDYTPLWKFVQVLNEAYDVDIEIESKDIAKLPYTATFHNEPLDNILNLVAQTFGLTVVRTNSRIVLK